MCIQLPETISPLSELFPYKQVSPVDFKRIQSAIKYSRPTLIPISGGGSFGLSNNPDW
jgi:hypothetical protein